MAEEYFRYTFKLERLKLDSRDFRQDSDSFVPHTELLVSVKLPRDNKYVANLSDISLIELGTGNEKKPVPAPELTPEGFAYIKKLLESAFATPKVSEEDWEESAVKTEKKLEPGKTQPEEWDKDPFKKSPDQEEWDEKQEEW